MKAKRMRKPRPKVARSGGLDRWPRKTAAESLAVTLTAGIGVARVDGYLPIDALLVDGVDHPFGRLGAAGMATGAVGQHEVELLADAGHAQGVFVVRAATGQAAMGVGQRQ